MKNSFHSINSLTMRPVTIAFLFLLFLCVSPSAHGQWTTTGSDIYNSNTGNVGIGTNGAPTSLLEVKKSQSGGTIITIDNPFTTAANTAYTGVMFKQAGVNRLLVSSVNDNHATITAGTAQFWNFANAPTVFATNNAERMRLTSTGNFGIGTTSPNERLVTFGNMLVGNINSHTQLYSTYDSQGNMIFEVGYGTATTDVIPLPSFVLSKNLTNANQGLGVISFANSSIANGNEKRIATISAFTDGALNSGALLFGTTVTGTVTERMRIASTGKIGVGTAAPTALFHVMTAPADGDALRLHRNANTNGFGVAQYYTLNNSSGVATDYAQISGGITSNTAGAETGALAFYTRNAGTLGERMRITNTGTVGIGTLTPNSLYRLDVQGGTINSSGGLCINGTCKTDWSQVGGSQWTTSGTTINYNTGNVGIGTAAAPTRKLEVVGGNVFHQFSTTVGSEYGFYTSLNNNHFTSNLYFDGQWKMMAAGKGALVATGPNNGGNAFAVYADNTSRAANATSTLAQVMVVSMDGKLGVNTPVPTEMLHITGNAKVTGNIDVGGNINAKYQDVAEWVESSQELTAGTVVVLDSDRSNQVVASTQAYDSHVAGVISMQPGITLGERGEGRVLVATTGRVKVKVDATNGPIKIGDLLVTSDKEGVAMKSIPIDFAGARIHRPGTLIGKALEPLAAGTGEILVLLSLQ